MHRTPCTPPTTNILTDTSCHQQLGQTIDTILTIAGAVALPSTAYTQVVDNTRSALTALAVNVANTMVRVCIRCHA